MNMNIRHMALSAAAGLLVLVGCQSGMYSTDVSVGRRAGGVSDYTVVSSLPDGDVPASMPVVVESKSTTEKGDHSLNDLLWFLTLGVIPGISSEATVYDVMVRTPLGERSGTCTVEACSWFGWLPIFLPYPGFADERAPNPKLPNVKLERQTCDRLVANLVSQFSKEEYASYAAKNNLPEMKAKRAQEAAERERVAKEQRVRLAKEAAERAEKRRLALRGHLAAEAVTNDLSRIRKCYSRGSRYQNPFLGGEGRNRDEKSDWLAHWASPRLALTEADAQAGEAALAEFGAKCLPNAYANYEKRREVLAEIQQVFNEEFPQPWTITEDDPKWHSFNRVLEKFVQARTEAFLCHDELCHYWLLWRLGVLSAGDLAVADAKKLSVLLLPENVRCVQSKLVPLKPLEGDVAAFAAKYAPASNGVYQRMAREFKEIDALLSEVFGQRRQMDDVRYSRALMVAVDKRNALARELNALSFRLQTWYMDYRTMVKAADDVARCDADIAKKLKPFLDSLPAYVKERTLGPVIEDADLVAIPGRNYRLQRTEVTQRQWVSVMGNNPSRFRGLDRPVENVSWNDCQEFIRRASALDGRRYRLPTGEEWNFACRAGSTTDWGKRANGECRPHEAMVWYDKNSGYETHPVAQKEPNAWGLYDMHGNVWEWCQDLYRDRWSGFHVRCWGGGWSNVASDCSASSSRDNSPYLGTGGGNVGFRLAVPQD